MLKKLGRIFIAIVMCLSIVSLNVNDTEAATSQQDKIVSIAMKEKGSKYKKKYGASPWCTSFISWAARSANISTSIIPKTSSSTTMYKQLLKNGGKIVKTPKKGDIVFYKKSAKSSTMIHAAIMTSSTMSIHGNYSKKVSYIKATNYYYSKSRKIPKNRIVYVRPNYLTKPSTPTITSVSVTAAGKTTVKFNKVKNASSYTLYLKDTTGKTIYTKSISSKYTTTTFNFSSNKPYGIYTVSLRANNSVGSSSLSKTMNVYYNGPTQNLGEQFNASLKSMSNRYLSYQNSVLEMLDESYQYEFVKESSNTYIIKLVGEEKYFVLNNELQITENKNEATIFYIFLATDKTNYVIRKKGVTSVLTEKDNKVVSSKYSTEHLDTQKWIIEKHGLD